ncbi:hypothetical protein DDR56_16785 [Halomonas venusta]|uniref:Secreted protein n=1 Tax=Vreelandella venusta TaxID=44935 RepID=A0ABX2BFS3_9GAMM|nr:hypothetical protein [Halomonas venusta]
MSSVTLYTVLITWLVQIVYVFFLTEIFKYVDCLNKARKCLLENVLALLSHPRIYRLVTAKFVQLLSATSATQINKIYRKVM